jgi:exosome complex exonuclease RRP6
MTALIVRMYSTSSRKSSALTVRVSFSVVRTDRQTALYGSWTHSRNYSGVYIMSDASTRAPSAVLATTDAGDVEEVLSALAKVTRAIVQNFPPPSTEDVAGDDEDWEYRRSFPEFQSSLALIHDTLLSFLQRLVGSCAVSANVMAMLEDEDKIEDIADPILWEQCMDVYDVLIQQVEAYLLEQSKSSDVNTPAAAVESLLSRPHSHRTSNSSQYYLQQQQQFKDIPKPQDIYSMPHHYRMNSQNYARTVPFLPKLHPNPPHFTPTAPRMVLVPGPGYATRFGALKGSNLPTSDTEDALIAPSQHCRHCYREELDALVYTAEQLRIHISESSPPIPVNSNIEYRFIDTLQGLQDLSALFENSENRITAIAVDLEAHSYRSFAGIVCLIQMSFRIANSDVIHNYIIDTLKLHDHVNICLASILANPTVVKVLHGADMDIQWLQRDFGLYVVNLFDTGRAARVLKEHKQLHSIGYASLVSHYCNGYTIDKKYQLADWRQRPLPEEMLQYAIQDTYYLIDIYEHMKHDLYVYGRETTDAIVDVLNTSRLVCAIRYCPEPFNPFGYRTFLLRTSSSKSNTKHKHQAYITPLQEAALASLWDWRDQTARNEDESTFYVCTNAQLLRLAYCIGPTLDVSQIESLFQPPPPLILKYAADLCELFRSVISAHQGTPLDASTIEATNADDELDNEIDEDDDDDIEDKEENDDDVETEKPMVSSNEPRAVNKSTNVGPTTRTSFSAFSKPASTAPPETTSGTNSSSRLNVATSGPSGSAITRGSPVLGTEALYEQAGWLTPIGVKPRIVKVHVTNEGSSIADAIYVSNDVTAMATTDDDVDDDIAEDDDDEDDSDKPKQLLSVNESNQHFRSNFHTEDSLDLKSGGRSASNQTALRKDAIPVVLGLVSSKGNNDGDDMEDIDDDPANRIHHKGGGASTDPADMEAEFVIPRSIREIYMISNRNRRNKKAGSPTPERGVTPTNEKERLALVEAEALLASRGAVAARYFFEDSSSGKRSKPSTQKTTEGRESEETLPYDLSVDVASKEDDFNFMKEIGWIPQKHQESTVEEFMQSAPLPGEGRAEADSMMHSGAPSAFTSHPQQAAVGLLHPTDGWNAGSSGHNPFFAGAAAQGGGPLQQQRNWSGPKAASTNASSGNKGKPANARNAAGRQPERPERKESRSYAYRKR